MTENKKPPAGFGSAPGALQNGSDGGKVAPRPRMVNGTLIDARKWLPLRSGWLRLWLPADFVNWFHGKGAT